MSRAGPLRHVEKSWTFEADHVESGHHIIPAVQALIQQRRPIVFQYKAFQ